MGRVVSARWIIKMNRKVCILAAGIGSRMGSYAKIINKTLLPVKNKAIISHIIDQFPEGTEFVIAAGFKGQLVRDYVSTAHANTKVEFVEVNNFDGIGAGPLQSLLACKSHLSSPFTLVLGDALYSGLNDLPTSKNCIAVAACTEDESPAYCNVQLIRQPDGFGVLDIKDKVRCDYGFAAVGAYHFKDVDSFWDNLNGTELSHGFSHLDLCAVKMKWTDLGTFDKYKSHINNNSEYDFSKSDEFLYLVNGKVIKIFANTQIAADRVFRSSISSECFPKITFSSEGIYSHDFVSGDVLYTNCNPIVLDKFLQFVKTQLWDNFDNENLYDTVLTENLCEQFYFNKTKNRLAMFTDKYPDFNPSKINGKKMALSIDSALNLINWNAITKFNLKERTKFIHGDLQPDNVIYDGDKFTLIDWRQDFAGKFSYGDMYYDVAKLLAGFMLNFDLIKKKMFTFSEKDQEVYFEFMMKSNLAQYREQLGKLAPLSIIEDITTLVFLNMAPLHEAPFDKLLFCLALERLNSKT